MKTLTKWMIVYLAAVMALLGFAAFVLLRGHSALCPDDRATATNPRCYVPDDIAVIHDGPDAGPTEFLSWYATDALTNWRVLPTVEGRVFHCPGGIDLIASPRAREEDVCAQAPGANALLTGWPGAKP